MSLNDILWRNQGNVLTPELILGIMHGASHSPDNAIANLNFEPELYKGVTFGVERISDIESEIAPLHQAHWEESESFRHGLPFKMDYETYKQQERAGYFLVFTIRDSAGALKGYCQVKISVSTHTGTKICAEDALYLHPDVRLGRTCVEFAKYSEKIVKQLGVQEIRLSVKVTNDIWKLWERIGYQRTGYELVKVLEG